MEYIFSRIFDINRKKRFRDQQGNTYGRHSNSFRYVIFNENVNRRRKSFNEVLKTIFIASIY